MREQVEKGWWGEAGKGREGEREERSLNRGEEAAHEGEKEDWLATGVFCTLTDYDFQCPLQAPAQPGSSLYSRGLQAPSRGPDLALWRILSMMRKPDCSGPHSNLLTGDKYNATSVFAGVLFQNPPHILESPFKCP